MANRQRYGAYALITVFIGLLAAFLLAEMLLRILGLGYSHSPIVSDAYLHHSHPGNFSFVSHHWTKEFGGHQIRYAADGRVVNPDDDGRPPQADRRVAFLGDSFVEALQVPWSESFVGVLDANKCDDIEIRNYGVSSYSPILYPIQWDKYIRDFDPDLVILMLYGNDVRDDESYLAHAKHDDQGNIVAVPGPKSSWFRLQLRRSYLLRFLRKQQLRLSWVLKHGSQADDPVAGPYVEESPKIGALTTGNLLRLRDRIAKNNGVLVLTAVPGRKLSQQPEDQEFADIVREWSSRYGIDYLDLAEPFGKFGAEKQSLFFRNDIHFNSRGHQLVADVIRNAYPGLFGCQRGVTRTE